MKGSVMQAKSAAEIPSGAGAGEAGRRRIGTELSQPPPKNSRRLVQSCVTGAGGRLFIKVRP